MPAAYLEKLNSEQRRAVEQGIRENACAPGVPLLVIAGAGSGKTNTLAHRVAHFIVNGADPRRILLMTFLAPSRRRDDPSGGTDMRSGAWTQCRHHERGARLGRYISRHRSETLARLRRTDRARSWVHNP